MFPPSKKPLAEHIFGRMLQLGAPGTCWKFLHPLFPDFLLTVNNQQVLARLLGEPLIFGGDRTQYEIIGENTKKYSEGLPTAQSAAVLKTDVARAHFYRHQLRGQELELLKGTAFPGF